MALLNLIASRRVRLLALAAVATLLLMNSSLFSNGYRRQFEQEPPVYLPTTSHADVNMREVSSAAAAAVAASAGLHTLRDQLAYVFPYNAESMIPRSVWQTWKTSPSDPQFPANYKHCHKKWTSACKDAGYSYNMLTDSDAMALLESVYAETPLVIKAYKLLPTAILRADFFRYLILFARGGIYSDMDTRPLKALGKWSSVEEKYLAHIAELSTEAYIPYKDINRNRMPAKASVKEPGLVIGIEADPDRDDWDDWYARRIQFCQWTIQAKPGHPALRELILNITATTLHSVPGPLRDSDDNSNLFDTAHSDDYNVNRRAKRGSDPLYKHNEAKVKKNVDGTDIMNWTGPGIFSDIIFEYLTNTLQHNNDIVLLNTDLQTPTAQNEDLTKSIKRFYKTINAALQTSGTVAWEFFAFLRNPVLVDDVMVLPITSFSPGVGQMEAKGTDDPMAFVEHMFSGSWKDEADGNKPAENAPKVNGGIPPVPA
ncbi:initiation-specific alpha-1,6-mannosyltransferase [Maudiozyma humilis]|uniref:Initiation-specific alpha-1,6-mannosyltransferase n=1 Tax=Maudiozyma humilis TaxID=51915 RepID=A0AAV5S2Q3_MAUHU|nr:initiation-specific alpha-1,6-mannosyltransferase [Kazachstania humilis]